MMVDTASTMLVATKTTSFDDVNMIMSFQKIPKNGIPAALRSRVTLRYKKINRILVNLRPGSGREGGRANYLHS